MATISSMTSSGLYGFGLPSTTSNNNNNMSFYGLSSGSTILSDYAALKNGSYKKLMSAYYKSENASSNSTDKADVSSAVKSLTKTTGTAKSLASSIDALNSDSLYEKKDITTKDDNGKKTTKNDYDWDTITKDVKSFVDAYNDTLDDAANSSSTSVLRNAAWMTKISSKNEAALAKAGISIGSDNKLSVDEDKLKTADINDVKNLFGGTNSYGAQMKYKAQMIGNSANSLANTYTGRGTYSSNYASTWGAFV